MSYPATHGMTKTPTYASWRAMRRRCEDSTADNYSCYGGRGITVCDRWARFENFLEDMGARPAGTTIERNDNEGHYEPGNCRWATKKEQARNRRTAHMLEMNGECMSIVEWAERTGIKRGTLSKRIHSGWTVERALTSGKYERITP